METTKPRSVLSTILIAAVTSAVSCIAMLWLFVPYSRAEVPATHGSMETVLEQLAELRDRMDAEFRSMRHVADRVPREAVPSRPDERRLTALFALLEEVVDRIGKQMRIARTLQPPALPRWTAENWDEVSAFRTRFMSDKKAAEKSVVLLTPSEVVSRFGFPTEVVAANAKGGGMCWAYKQPGAEDVTFWFQDGYLLHVLR